MTHYAIALLLAAASTLVATPAQATILHAEFDTPTFDNGVSMGGPNLLLAIKTQMPAAGVVTRVEVFTGETIGNNTVAIWSHDAASNAPLAQLGVGDWDMCRRNGWQGAPLVLPVPVIAGQDVWIVWGCRNGAQASSAGNGAGAQSYRGSFNGGSTWNGPFVSRQWKFRCWTGTAGHYEVYGSGCAGSAGTPELCWSGMPLAGSSFDLHLDNAPANGLAVLSFGFSDTMSGGQALPFSLGGLGAPGCDVLASPLTTVFVGTNNAGSATLPVNLVANPAFVGLEFFDQWFCLDPGANALGITVSNAGKAVVGA